ncbi:hypothetical protein LIER_09944 [Lithospermum erythrorhizon]|uniref:Uncharacterized protein n=1 Tax=Lithospermum erythrorhizon TaxID=34254 RepID=A0AAV3PHP0_LITER
MEETWIGFEQDNNVDGIANPNLQLKEGEVQTISVQEGFWQTISLRLPTYCSECFHLVYKSSQCKRAKGELINPFENPAVGCPNLILQEKEIARPLSLSAKKVWIPKESTEACRKIDFTSFQGLMKAYRCMRSRKDVDMVDNSRTKADDLTL